MLPTGRRALNLLRKSLAGLRLRKDHRSKAGINKKSNNPREHTQALVGV